MPTLDYRRFWRWFIEDFLGIVREMRWSYVPPLMIYLAAGISGFTGIVESFFVKKELGLSAAFLASLAFWAGLPCEARPALPRPSAITAYWLGCVDR